MQISIYEEMQSMHSTLKLAISSTGMPPPSLLQLACDSQHKQAQMVPSDSAPLALTDLGDDKYGMYKNAVWTLVDYFQQSTPISAASVD